MEAYEELAENLGQAVALGFEGLSRWQSLSAHAPPGALEGLSPAFLEAVRRLASEPGRLAEAGLALGERLEHLWQETWQGGAAPSEPTPARPGRGDRRYRDPAW